MPSGHQSHATLRNAALLDAAREVLTADGEQWTAMREQVFGILAQAGQPVSAYDVAEQLSAILGRRIVPNSVYRILDLFVARYLALKVETRNAYLVNVHPGWVHDCIFLICEDCGETTHVDDSKAVRAVRQAASSESFAVKRSVIEVLGLCRTCAV